MSSALEDPHHAGVLSRRHLLEAALMAPPAFVLLGCREEPPPATHAARTTRAVTQLLTSIPSTEGAGVHIKRTIGSRVLSVLDPFLLLDEIHSDHPQDYEKGFPNHPHRGFETVTYMLDGAMEHRDSVGNRGLLGPGSAQWMTAGHGIIHSEMPRQREGNLWGLQLWVNLPSEKKLIPPRYQDIPPDRIPEVSVQGNRVRVAAGTLGGESGPVEGIAVDPTLVDVTLSPGSRFEQPLPPDHTLFAFVLSGTAEFGRDYRAVPSSTLAVFGPGDTLVVKSSGGARFLLCAGRPIGEPVARRGPFVMNTEEQLDRAVFDYRNGTLTSG